MSCLSACRHYCDFQKTLLSKRLTSSPISFWSYVFLSVTCCSRSLSKHFIHAGLSTPKIVSLYLIIVPLMAFFKLLCLSADIFHSFVSCSNIVLFVCFTKAAPKQHWYDISDSQKNYLILTKFYKQKKNYLILTKFYKHLIYPYTILLSFSYCLLAYTNPTNLMDVILHMKVICL